MAWFRRRRGMNRSLLVALGTGLALTMMAASCDPTEVVAESSAPIVFPTTTAPLETTTTTERERDNSIVVPHRVLVDGSDIGTPFNTAVVRAEDVWELNPEAELDDSGTSVNLLFTTGVSPGCFVLDFDGVRFDPNTSILFPALERGGSNCEDQASNRPYTVVVSVVRRDLPRTFVMSSDREVPAAGLVGQTEIAIGQLGIPDGDPLALSESSNMMIGDVRYLEFDTHCGVEQIAYLIDGNYWTLSSGPGTGDFTPSEWRRFVDGETLMLQLELQSPELLFVSPTGSGLELAYEPIDESELRGCM